jgi:hypothetical protein
VTLTVDASGKNDDYARYGKRVIAAIAASGLRHGRTVTIANQDKAGVRFSDGVASTVGDATSSGSGFIRYWKSLTS